jgi:hypothetical protein
MGRQRLVGRVPFLLLALSLLAPACASHPLVTGEMSIHHHIKSPSPERVKAFAPADQSGVMMKDSQVHGVGMVRRLYVPETVFPGTHEREEVVLALSFVVLDWQAMQPGSLYKKAFLAPPEDLSYFKQMKLCRHCLREIPTEPNRQGPFFQPVRAKIGAREYWLVNNRYYSGESGSVTGAATLEIYDQEPAGSGRRPLAVWVFGSREGRADWDFKRGPWPLQGKFYVISDFQKDPQDDSRVVALTAEAWQPKLDDILLGLTAAEVFPRNYLRDAAKNNTDLEGYLNETLLEWKSGKFPELLQTASAAALKDLAVKLEKAILKLDLRARELKDAADEDARQVPAPGQKAAAKKAPAGALATAHLLEQRKTILMVLLGPVKQAAAGRG